jgi:diguanylate cyclase (GGDEF)-like protein
MSVLVDDGLPEPTFNAALAAQVQSDTPAAQIQEAGGDSTAWRTALCVPLRSPSEVLGVVQLWSVWEQPFSTQEVELVAALCAEAAVAVDNARLRTEMRRAAATDPLTGLLNRREFHDRLVAEVKRSVRHEHMLSLVLLDIDDFKTCNDTCGHAAGDQVLRTLSSVIRDAVRSEDVAGRYGGDEFMILLPDTDERGARTVAEGLCKRFNQRLFTTDGAIYKVTLSAGVAMLGSEPSATLLMKKADRALLQAKQHGKNQVRVWTGGEVLEDLASPIRYDA